MNSRETIAGSCSKWIGLPLLVACGTGFLGCGGSTQASSAASGAPSTSSSNHLLNAASADAKADSPASASSLATKGDSLKAPHKLAGSTPALLKTSVSQKIQEKPTPEQSAPAKAPLITLRELGDRRDLWPTKVRLTKKVGFSPTETYKAGSEFDLVEIAGSNLHLDIGGEVIEVPSASTDILDRASDLMASLTPEQLALTAAMLPKRPELWPVELKITRPLGFSNGSKVPVGRTVLMRTFEGDQVNVYDRDLKTYYPAAINETDIIARARERLKLDEKNRDPFFLRSVGATLESTGNTERDGAFSKSDYVFVYSARLGCSRCAMFLPHLKEAYDRLKPAHPEFEVVFMSQDFKAEDAKELAAKESLPGRAVAYDRRLEAADLGTKTQNGELLPLVYLYDRSGKLVARNLGSGGKPSAEDVLATLEKKLTEKH